MNLLGHSDDPERFHWPSVKPLPERLTLWALAASSDGSTREQEYVPASQLAGAVTALTELLAAVDSHAPFDAEPDGRLYAAIDAARSVLGGQ
jgi:hypothetical protein